MQAQFLKKGALLVERWDPVTPVSDRRSPFSQ